MISVLTYSFLNTLTVTSMAFWGKEDDCALSLLPGHRRFLSVNFEGLLVFKKSKTKKNWKPGNFESDFIVYQFTYVRSNKTQ